MIAVTALPDIDAAADDIIEAFAALLAETGRPLLDLPDLLAAWDAADPGWAGTGAGRLRLSDALDRLEAAGVVELPSRRGARWESALPRLPLRIAIPANRRMPARALDPAGEPWVPALAWAGAWIRGARPPQRLRLALAAINRWLASTMGRAVPAVCREERSLDIFDDEKMLASLAGTALFGAGRLTLDVLACEAPVGGIRVARVADAGPVLILENKATFDSAWRGLRASMAVGAPPGYAAVVFGGGDQAASLVADLVVFEALVGVRPSRFEYAGDIDVAGVSAAAAFIDTARSAGLRAGPALPLWQALGAATPAGEDLTGDPRERRAAVDAASRLGLPDVVAERLKERVRVPQERLDRTRLADVSWWTPSA
ncbi:hypothetical protein [Sorangium sp. So ce388]|uniref:hypothetical protein n=1 Tax=Sorangium sp. So ce388 TaxID=3133309 RepID=UPI003F5B1EA1